MKDVNFVEIVTQYQNGTLDTSKQLNCFQVSMNGLWAGSSILKRLSIAFRRFKLSRDYSLFLCLFRSYVHKQP